MKKKISCIIISFVAVISSFARTINMQDFGAKPDGKSDNTSLFQKAIDECTLTGGGTLVVPAGRYLIGPIFMKSNVALCLEQGAVLLGNTDITVYHNMFAKIEGSKIPALIYGENIENVSITGHGKIDGQGGHSNFQLGDDSQSSVSRPILLYFKNVRGIHVSDVSLHNSAYWVQKYEACDNVLIHGIKVYSHTNFNNDGLDINGSKNVRISDCFIDTDDDALCFKSESGIYSLCENITVTNCILRSNCNGIKCGTGSMMGFKNITISNCVIYKASEDNRRHWKDKFPWMGITSDKTVIAGIALECVDGGEMEQISIMNITMKDVQTPIFIRAGDRKRVSPDKISTIKNIQISQIMAVSESLLASSITGIPESRIENVSISQVKIISPGGTNQEYQPSVPEKRAGYPENRMFGNILPASGFYVRHVDNICFHDVKIQTRLPDKRPSFYMDDVKHEAFSLCTFPKAFHKACW